MNLRGKIAIVQSLVIGNKDKIISVEGIKENDRFGNYEFHRVWLKS